MATTHSAHQLRMRGVGLGCFGIAGNLGLWLIQEFWVKMPHFVLWIGVAICVLLALIGGWVFYRSFHVSDSQTAGEGKPESVGSKKAGGHETKTFDGKFGKVKLRD